MSKVETGGPAFPFAGHVKDAYGQADGMTLRDYFAAKAMQAMISADALTSAANVKLTTQGAYQFADYMIKARKGE